MSSLSLKLLILILFIENITSDDLPFGSECRYSDELFGTCSNLRNCPVIFNQIQRKVLARNDIVFCNDQLRLICCPDMEDHKIEQTTEKPNSKRRGLIPSTTAAIYNETPIRTTPHAEVPRISDLSKKTVDCSLVPIKI